LGGVKSTGLNLWPERVDQKAVRSAPNVILWDEMAIGPIDQLAKLTRCVDVAIPSRKSAVIELIRDGGRDHRVSALRHEIVEPVVAQISRDVLGEAASGGYDAI
jgi:hypothetical protein